MDLRKYMKGDWRGWIFALFLLPIFIVFQKSFEAAITTVHFNSMEVEGLYALVLVFVISFFVFSFFYDAFSFNESTDGREYDSMDVRRFKSGLKWSLTTFSVSEGIWLFILTNAFLYKESVSFVTLIFLLGIPTTLNGLMVYFYSRINGM